MSNTKSKKPELEEVLEIVGPEKLNELLDSGYAVIPLGKTPSWMINERHPNWKVYHDTDEDLQYWINTQKPNWIANV